MTKKKSTGDTTKNTDTTMTAKCAVDDKKKEVVSPVIKKISLNELPVCDPGAASSSEVFIDNIFDTDDYESD